ncbi:hypothetical protein [Clostridium frigidicarnis]|uniref:Uncharacterized protein n=1 Tax=Clostridium frigidicarnis TaxID=84698 RepID=A0A1I1ALQ2_9CLOT|nr:hypothetical protein [Clostridium frigidicarnis]SFB38934.1 hypothetical protein SAMN04488528_104015 [Clostridium frigidicarnis]
MIQILVIQDLNLLIVRVDKEDQDVYKKLKVLFAPTGEFQEISINSGWTKEYL